MVVGGGDVKEQVKERWGLLEDVGCETKGQVYLSVSEKKPGGWCQ